jgi:hypothetical protein
LFFHLVLVSMLCCIMYEVLKYLKIKNFWIINFRCKQCTNLTDSFYLLPVCPDIRTKRRCSWSKLSQIKLNDCNFYQFGNFQPKSDQNRLIQNILIYFSHSQKLLNRDKISTYIYII